VASLERKRGDAEFSRTLLELAGCSRLDVGSSVFVPVIDAVRRTSSLKKTSCGDAANALTVLLRAAEANLDGSLRNDVQTAIKYFSDVSNGPIVAKWTASMLTSCSDDELVAIIRASRDMIRRQLNLSVEDKIQTCSVIAQCGLSSKASVRNRSREVAAELATSNADLSVLLLEGLWRRELVGNDASETSETEEQKVVLKERLNAIAIACAGSREVSCVPLLLVVTHHPKLCWPGHRSYWNYKYLPPVEQWHAAACDLLLSKAHGLKSANAEVIQGACSALRSLAAVSPSSTVENMLSPLFTFLRKDDVAKLTEEELDIYFEATSAARSANDSEGSLAESETTSTTKKGSKSSQSSARDKQAMQAELDRKKKAQEAAEALQAEKQRQRTVAETVGAIFVEVRAGLLAIATLCDAAPTLMHLETPQLLRAVLQVAQSGAEESACRAALTSLAKCGPPKASQRAEMISAALYDLYRNKQASLSGTLLSEVDSVTPPPLDAESFMLFLPIIESVLTKPPEDHGSSVDLSLSLLEKHVTEESFGAAVECANQNAGLWLLTVLEREDSLFSRAMNALGDLVETALAVGPQLAQVLKGLVSGKSSVREATLEALERLPELIQRQCKRDALLGQRLWLAMHDVDETLSEIAQSLWNNYGHQLSLPEDVPALLELVAANERDIRVATSRSLGSVLGGGNNAKERNLAIAKLFKIYLSSIPRKEEVDPRAVRRTRGGAPGKSPVIDDRWFAREGVALTLGELATRDALSQKDFPVVFTFLAAKGLGDSSDEVRSCMSSTAVAVVHAAGKEGPTLLLPMIEAQLKKTPPAGESEEVLLHLDRTHENLVVCLGTVASYLPDSDQAKVASIAELLMKTATESQSESVQRASSRCLQGIAKALRSSEEAHRELLFKELFGENPYARRRGAAYALAGLLRGLGLPAVKRMKILEELRQCLSGKSPQLRQSALFLLETLALSLERLFEPYFVSLLPLLLQSMNDVPDVRDACWQASEALMSSLSAHGVRLVLPSLIAGLNDRSWRIKAGSADLLGAMAFCAPRQLAQSLPLIVPQLATALADAHPKVVSAAEAAVSRIAAVTNNPEVRSLSSFLLAALKDPAGRTAGAIDAMLQTEFIHAVDPASLALLMPPLHRALRERSSELKKRAAAIVGSMCSHVTNPSDVVPYLDLLLPDLRAVILDPIPDVRKTAASALGSLAEGLGAESLPGVTGWLLATAVSSSLTTAERSGAALGLAAISVALSDVKINGLISTMLKKPSEVQTPAEVLAAKEGGLLLLASMPSTLKERFEVRLSTALPVILRGLADEADNVREAALGAGRSIVSAFGRTSLDRLLPLLCDSMQDDFWRIRQNSTQLLGDLLLSLAGAKATTDGTVLAVEEEEDDDSDEEAKSQTEDDEDHAPEEAFTLTTTVTPADVMTAMNNALGQTRRNEVIATLYLARNDVSSRVRMTAIQVWKMVVSNTARTLREILSSATQLIIHGLSSSNEERRAIAARALGDLGQKLGDHVFPQVLPLLRDGLRSKDAGMRRGACEGLAELVAASTKQQLLEHASGLLPAVRDALCDELDDVRSASASVFASLSKPLGYTTAETVVQELVVKAAAHQTADVGDDEGAEVDSKNYALDGLQRVLAVSGGKMLSSVVLRVISEKPMSPSGMLAIAAAARVAHSTFEPHLKEVIASLVESFIVLGPDATAKHVSGSISIFEAVASGGEDASKALLVEILSPLSHNVEMRIAGAKLLGYFCRALGASSGKHGATILEALVRQLADADMNAVKEAWEALRVLSEVVPAPNLSAYLSQLRHSLRLAAANSTYHGENGDADEDKLAGLCLPKGPAPLIPMLTHGLLHGTPELREQAALAIAEVVALSDQKAMNPFVVKLTGPLIRVISDRFPWQVKAAILQAMLRLLRSCANMVKMLIPQLQSIFLKSLADPTRTVRRRALAALAELMKIHPRPVPVVNDLINMTLRDEQASSTRASALCALAAVFTRATKLPENASQGVTDAVLRSVLDEDGEVRKAAALAIGRVTRASADDHKANIIGKILSESDSTSSATDGKLLSLQHVLRECSSTDDGGQGVADAANFLALEEYILEKSKSEAAEARQQAVATAAEAYVLLKSDNLLNCIVETATEDPVVDVRAAALKSIGTCGSAVPSSVRKFVAPVVAAAHERNTMVKYTADKALRGLFLEKTGAERTELYNASASVLPAEQFEWLGNRISKLQTTPESDDEEDDMAF